MEVPGPGWKPGEKHFERQTWIKKMGPCNSIILVVSEDGPKGSVHRTIYNVSARTEIGELYVQGTRTGFTVLKTAGESAEELGQMIDRVLKKGLV